ncbi:hypothetical protein ABFY59_13140 [Priestia aryabhattai]|uniref:hypothetical protein n=1 Tax=Priestia aryabhattai TaxID=412384 RepID=UPI003D292D89
MSDILKINTQTCSNCKGEGVTKDSFPEHCKYCNGSGEQLPSGSFVKVSCHSCNEESFIGVPNLKVEKRAFEKAERIEAFTKIKLFCPLCKESLEKEDIELVQQN